MVTVSLTHPCIAVPLRMESAKVGGTMAQQTTNLGPNSPLVRTHNNDTGKTVSRGSSGCPGGKEDSRGNARLTSVACTGDIHLRHAEALICVVALLAKRPDSHNAHLLSHERMSISETYVAAPYRAAFTVTSFRMTHPNMFAP